MAETLTSLSADLPSGLWALLVVGVMLGAATVLYLWWELFFKFLGIMWRRLFHSRTRTLDDDGISQHRR